MNLGTTIKSLGHESFWKGLFDNLPMTLAYIGLIVLAVNSVSTAFLSKALLDGDKVMAVITIVASVFIVALHVKLNNIEHKDFGSSDDIIEVLHHHERVDFKSMLTASKNVKLLSVSGTRAGELGDSLVQANLKNLPAGTSVIILLANPYSEAVKLRYENDEPTTYEAGLEGISRRLVYLNDIVKDLAGKSKTNLEVRVFDNYPTISIIQADHDIYATNYGYQLRGGDCPKIHIGDDSIYGRFLLKHFEKVYQDAQPLNDWHTKHFPQEASS